MNVLFQLTQKLQSSYAPEEARALSRIILEDAFGLKLTDILMDKDTHLSADNLSQLENITTRLLQGEPIQYILGTTVFLGHRFHVAPDCLIPRPETEDLVMHLLHDANGIINTQSPLSLLDIGTGSGCIAISLSLALAEHANVFAMDINHRALSIAQKNAQILDAKVNFQQANILDMPPCKKPWDIIVSNPPYVRFSEAKNMHSNVLKYEPHEALFVPDNTPLCFYEAIAQYAYHNLNPDGRLYFEINQFLAEEIKELLKNYGFIDIKCIQDRFFNPRIIKCRHQ